MSSMLSEHQPMRAQNKNHHHNAHHRKNAFNVNAQKKFKHDRNGRKRSKSFSGGGGSKMKNMQPALPTKFLLGGNINDPLNLNSLQDAEINRAMNAVTPKSSPIPTPPRRKGKIEVIIPPNINDPLNLIDCADDAEYEQQLCGSPVKKGRKKRTRKRRTTSSTLDNSDGDVVVTEARTPEANEDTAKIPEVATATDAPKAMHNGRELTLELSSPKKTKRKSEEHKDSLAKKMKHSMDKIVSPVIPQPGAWLGKRTNNHHHHWNNNHNNKPKQDKDAAKLPQFKEKNKQFQYGNYNRYYGYRNPQNEIDPRLKCFQNYRYLFEGKDILDVGCNIGHITLSIARDFAAKSVVGIDIDKKLIGIARKNVKHYVSSETPSHEYDTGGGGCCYDDDVVVDGFGDGKKSRFCDQKKGQGFPNNVTFVQGNYVLEDESLLNVEQSQFDVIVCLSITKWIHLNWGDAGIKRAFKRMFAQLKPGGKLVLEPQNWKSYKSKKNLTETIYKNYNSIELFPENFTQYLLSTEVGFAKSEILGFPQHHSKGFQRPIHVYTKSTILLSDRVECSQISYVKNVYLPTESPCKTNGVNVNRDGYVNEKCEDGVDDRKSVDEIKCDDSKSSNEIELVDDKKNLTADNT